jgi:hydroxymethylpyrimidine pyrophosphatase-like HAD family hydrolase
VLAAGDHLNDLPMLKREFAHYLVAPVNAIPEVKEVVAAQGGFVSTLSCGNGVAEGMEYHLRP